MAEILQATPHVQPPYHASESLGVLPSGSVRSKRKQATLKSPAIRCEYMTRYIRANLLARTAFWSLGLLTFPPRFRSTGCPARHAASLFSSSMGQ